MTVRCAAAEVSGQALGGRRGRVALVALALSGGHVPADRLAATIWGDDLPATWQTALRGVVRGLRSACAPAGGGGQRLIATTPSGYRLADGVTVDVSSAARNVRRTAARSRRRRCTRPGWSPRRAPASVTITGRSRPPGGPWPGTRWTKARTGR